MRADEHPAEDGVDYRPSGVLFRMAVAASARAARYEAQFRDGGEIERRNRVVDECISTIVLVQAALESYVNDVYRDANAEPRNGWIQRFTDLNSIQPALGRPATAQIDAGVTDQLRQLSAWRQFLVHGDENTRTRFAKLSGIRPADVPGRCTAASAREWIALADRVFDWAAETTGTQMQRSSEVWLGFD
jgi:hypothetical protein